MTSEFALPTPGEEIANTISHGIGLALAMAATPILITAAVRGGSVWSLIGASVFAGAMLSLYFASTLYHALRHDKAKRFFRTLDHGAIFLLIAGTYTPFTLGVLRGPWGWTLLGLIWAMAAAGLTMKAFAITRYRWLSMVLYLSMGWLVVIAAKSSGICSSWPAVPVTSLPCSGIRLPDGRISASRCVIICAR